MTVYEDALQQAVNAGDLSQEDFEAIGRLLHPPEPTTVEGYIRAEILDAITNVLVYGQHPPPEEPQVLEGIRVDVVDWMPEGVALVTADPVESIRAAIEKIQHDPLWSLDRPRV